MNWSRNPGGHAEDGCSTLRPKPRRAGQRLELYRYNCRSNNLGILKPRPDILKRFEKGFDAMSPHFKTCPFCSKIWPSRDEFLSDDDITLIGYQVDFEELSLGLVLFNHSVCQTTMAIRAGQFRDLYLGPVFSERRTGETDCPGHCLKRTQLCACPAECECAWVRELLPIIRSWPKPSATSKTAIG